MHFIFIRPTRSFGSWRIYGLFSRLLSALACKPINSSKSIPDSLFLYIYKKEHNKKSVTFLLLLLLLLLLGKSE